MKPHLPDSVKSLYDDYIQSLYDDYVNLYELKSSANEKYKDVEKNLVKLEKDYVEANEAFESFDKHFSTLKPIAKFFAFNKYQKLQKDHFYKRNLFNDFSPRNYQSDFFAADIKCRSAAEKFANALYEAQKRMRETSISRI